MKHLSSYIEIKGDEDISSDIPLMGIDPDRYYCFGGCGLDIKKFI